MGTVSVVYYDRKSKLQDDIDATDEMIDAYYKGSDLVLGVRSERQDDPLSERFFPPAVREETK